MKQLKSDSDEFRSHFSPCAEFDLRPAFPSMSTGTQRTNRCPQCGGATRLDEGVCVSCLLREGLRDRGEASAEIFENALAEAQTPDTSWHLGNYESWKRSPGGMGVVYRARQRHSRRTVALKRVLAYHGDSHERLSGSSAKRRWRRNSTIRMFSPFTRSARAWTDSLSSA